MWRLIHILWQLDRDNSKEPSLLEMTKTAIRSLERATRHSDKGFFLVRLPVFCQIFVMLMRRQMVEASVCSAGLPNNATLSPT